MDQPHYRPKTTELYGSKSFCMMPAGVFQLSWAGRARSRKVALSSLNKNEDCYEPPVVRRATIAPANPPVTTPITSPTATP